MSEQDTGALAAAPGSNPPELRVERRPVPAEPLAGAADLLPPLLQQIYSSRGISHAAELDTSLGALAAPDSLPDLTRAADRLVDAVTTDEHILIVGDFDADGATGVALGVSLLQALGAARVSFLVPNRFEFGYGLSPEIVEQARGLQPNVIVTVDNGVSSVAGVALAAQYGIEVVVTDHHLPGVELPAAHSIVNPNLAGSQFPSKAMAGVGVIYYLLSAVRAALKQRGWFDTRPVPNLADWLDLVALGTVADVVPLDHNNRILVRQGLQRMRAGRCRPGIKALCEVAQRDLAKLQAADLGFALGPRLNAAGRLDDMSIGIRCLLAEHLGPAREVATALDELNRTRRALEQEMLDDADLLLAGQPHDAEDRFGVCVYNPAWHQGVVGIVAGRLRERLHRPVIAFAEAGGQAPDELKGSARSLPELHIRDLLDRIAARYPGMLVNFGGHAMAAGLSIKRVHLPRFELAFNRFAGEMLPAHALSPVLLSDGHLTEAEMTLEMAAELADAGPWGQQFPEPLFHDEFEIVSQRVVGVNHLKLVLRKGGKVVDAIAFRQAPLAGASRVLAAFRLQQNDYRNSVTLQLVVEHIAPLA